MNIIWDISNKCNLQCKHCGEQEFMKNSEKIERKDILNIAENLSQIANNVTLLGGEPLLVPNINEVCNIFIKNEVGVDLITNGQIYNQSIENMLKMENVGYIYVSIDGIEEDNDEVRGRGSWNKAIEFLQKIVMLKSISKTIGVTAVLTKKSIRHLKEFMEYFNEFGIDIISFSLLDITGNAVAFKDELLLDDLTILESLELILSLKNRVSYKIVIDSGSVIVDKYLRNKTGYVKESIQKECDALYHTAYCDMNGYLYPCRAYCGKGIDLKAKVDWERGYSIFEPFLEKLFCSAEQVICPLKNQEDSTLDILARQKLTEIVVPDYKINQTIIFNEIKSRYFVIFCKTNEYVEYTKEGFLIYRLLYSGLTTREIAFQLEYSVEDVWNFLDGEFVSNRITYVGS